MPVSTDAQRALALLERVQRKVCSDDGGRNISSQVNTDLDMLSNLLRNPVLKNILAVQDSLENLHAHMSHHPSLLPADFDIDTSGHLVLNANILHSPVQPANNNKLAEGKSSPIPRKSSFSKSVSPVVPEKESPKGSAAFQQALQQAAALREIISIQLNKPEGQSLGFSVVGLRSDQKGDLGIFIQEIQPTGIAGRDGRLREGDQILAIDGQVLEAAISHQAAIGILQRARGLVDLVVARGLNPLADVPVPLIPAFNLPQVSSTPQAATAAVLTTATSQQHSPDSSHSRHPSSSHSHSGSSLSASPEPSISAAVGGSSANFLATTATTLTAAAVGRSPSALSDTSKTGSDMVLNTEWAQVEVVDLINDGSGLGFGIIGGRSTGVVVKTIVPGGVADRDGRLQSGDHILQIGEVSLRGMGSEQVAAVLRQSGTQVRLIVARPIEPSSPDYQGMSSSAPIVPTKVLGDPEELEKHLTMLQNGFNAETYAVAAVAVETDQTVDPNGILNINVGGANGVDINSVPPSLKEYGDRFIFAPPTVELERSEVQLHVSPSNMHDLNPALVHMTGTHLTSSTTESVPVQLELGQIVTLGSDLALDYLPEVENFDVELKKDSQGLGITIAGYVCEREELSGIFVKSINPGSVADSCGRIQINDQIVEVDGKSLRGFNNHQAVEVLRSTGQVVKLRLARYLRGPKYDQLQQAMADSVPAAPAPLVQAAVMQQPESVSSVAIAPPVFPAEMTAAVVTAETRVVADPETDDNVLTPQVPEPVRQLDLDLVDPANVEPTSKVNDVLLPEIDYSSLSLGELEKRIDSVYSETIDPQCEAAIIAKWRMLVDSGVDIVVAQLSKFQPTGGLGISLEGTVDVEEGREVRPHHYIRSILPDGPVGQNGILRSGDELLEVNGRKLLGLSHVEVVSILKDLPQWVRMVCARRQTLPPLPSRPIDPTQDRAAFAARNILGGSLQSLIPPSDRLVKAKSDGSLASTSVSAAADSPLSKSYRSRSLEPLSGLATWSSEPQVIELIKGDRGLGFSILDYQDPMNPNETIIVIRSLVPGGVAQQDGRLIPGDRLLFVNDINLENAALDEAVQALKGAPKGVVRIGVAKPHPVALSEGNVAELQEDDAEYNSDQDDDDDVGSHSSSSEDEGNDTSNGDYLSNAAQVKVPPPLPQSEPPALDCESPEPDSIESEPPNPLLVPVATERLLGSSTSGPENMGHVPEVPPLPSALEQTIRIKKGSDPLGINVEVVDGGVNGVVITSINRGGAIHRDGRLKAGDCLISVNHESMRFATNAQARAILRRTQLISTDVSIVYIPANDAAVHRQTAMMQLAQEMDNNAAISTFKPLPTVTSASIFTSSRSLDSHVVVKAEEPPTTVQIQEDIISNDAALSTPPQLPSSGVDSADSDPKDLTETDARDSSSNNIDGESGESPKEEDLSSSTTTILQVPGSTSAIGKAAGVGGASPSSGMSPNPTILARHWGPERSVKIVRDPAKSLGISIVGGKVDVSTGSGSPISGIFIKNVLPDSPAGRTGQLRTGDRILEVDGENLRSASHERAVEVIRKAGNPVTFVVQSLVDWEQETNAYSNSLVPSALSKYSSREGINSPVTDAEHMTPIPNGATTPLPGSDGSVLGLPKVAPLPGTPARSPTPEIIQTGGPAKPPPRKRLESSSSEDEDSSDMQGKTTTASGVEIDRASAGHCKLSSAEKQEETEEPDDFGYTQKKIQKRWGDLSGEVVRVDLDRSVSTISSLGLSLAGHKDRQVMAVFICGLNPNGIAYKDGRLQVGDELLEVNGNVIHGRCHLNASAIIKSLAGTRVTIIALRREGALQDVAVPPITRFPITLDEQPPEERYARFKNLRIISLKKGNQGLGIMIIEGRHSEVGNGIFISDIQEGSVAEQAGLSVGDMILCVNKDELLGADYDTAASVLKKSEGLLNIVVCNPGKAEKQAVKKDEKPKVPPKPLIAPKPSVAARLTCAKSVSSTSLPPTSLESHPSNPSLLSQSAPQSPLNNPLVGPRTDPRDRDASDNSSCSEMITSFSEPVVATPIEAHSPSSHPVGLGRAAHGVSGTAGFKGAAPHAQTHLSQPPASTQQAKAVLRQHGGPGSSVSKNSTIIKAVDEPPPDPATCEVKPGKETTIEVNKDKLGLGLSIVGGSDTLLGAILIHEVYPDGAAARDGRLKPGDQILEVNGESFRNITHSRALAVLRQTPAKVKMMVYRDETSSKDDDMLDIIEVELLKKPGRGLGLSIVGRRNGPGVYISDVVKGGAAEADGRLMQGDQILTVNGNDLRTASQEQAAAVLKTAMGKIDLKVGRLKAGAASPRSATSAESPAPSHPPPPVPPVREDSLPVGDCAADSPPPPLDASGAGPTYTKVYLERGADGLGFSIVGGRGNPQGDLPIFVKSVFDRGAAAQSGLLRPGDQIHAVDDILLEGKTHQEAVALLKNAKGTVTLTIVS